MRAKYIAWFFFFLLLLFLLVCEEGRANGCYFPPEKNNQLNVTGHVDWSHRLFTPCSSAMILFLPFPSFTHRRHFFSFFFFFPSEWLTFRAPSVWVQSYQVLLMCFQFPPILLAQPTEKPASILQRAALFATMLPVSVQDSFHIWLWAFISSDWRISLTPAPKHRLGLQKRSYGPNRSMSEWQEGNPWWQNCPSE